MNRRGKRNTRRAGRGSGQAAERRTLDQGRSTSRKDGGSRTDTRGGVVPPHGMASPSSAAGNGRTQANRARTHGGADPPEAVVEHATTPRHEDSFSWTETGVRLSVDGLTIEVDDVGRERDGRKATVSVRWRDRLCYGDRTNPNAARQREQFVKQLLLACQQPGMKVGPPSRIARRVTAALIQLGAACRERPAQAAAAEQSAGTLLDDPDVLERVGEAMVEDGYVGDPTPAQLAYVALTSRLMERPINLAFVADAAAGKNATIDAACALVPRGAVYEFSASSPTSIVYTDEDFANRVVVFKEADSIPDDGPAASAVRALADDNNLRYEVTVLNPRTGTFETQITIKPGPTGLMTTSLRALRHQLNTRVLQVPVAADVATTRAVLRAKGRAAGRAPTRPDRGPFLALQRWLTLAGRRRVIVPFGELLAQLLPEAPELRMRRDFEKLLSCVKTIAFLRQCQRQKTPGGEIIATVDDYKVARNLLSESFDAPAVEGLTQVVRETVEAIKPHEWDISMTDLAMRLRVSRQLISWRVKPAIEKGWLVNAEKRKGKAARLRRGNPLPEDVCGLPDASRVAWGFVGVPDPVLNPRFRNFASDMATCWREGFTTADLAEVLEEEPEAVRRRLDTLVAAGLLVYDPTTDRHAVLFWVPDLMLLMAE